MENVKKVLEYKEFQPEIKASNEADLTVDHFISTEDSDRGGDIMRAKGMYMNGRVVVLHSHGFGPHGSEPIARPLSIRATTIKGVKGIVARTQYFPDEIGARLWRKAVEGYMPNWSIGYRVDEYKEIDGGRGRDITKWELVEYSQVAVPMNPGATTFDKNVGNICFKFIDDVQISPVHCGKCGGDCECDKEDVFDTGILSDSLDVDLDEKPYPNEHACRVNDPDKYKRIRRENDKFGKGIDVIWGVTEEDDVEVQALRFDAEKFTSAEARAWCKSHDYTCRPFEPASGKSEGSEETDREHELIKIVQIDEKLTELIATIQMVENRIAEVSDRVDKMMIQLAVSSERSVAEGEGGEENNDNSRGEVPVVKRLVLVEESSNDKIDVQGHVTKIVTDLVKSRVEAELDRLTGKVR